MDARRNPFSPGAGTPPPELAGRETLIERNAVALDRIRAGRAARPSILYGLRGVGKTVLLSRIRDIAEGEGMIIVSIEAPESRSLPGMIVPKLRAALLRLDRMQQATKSVTRALRALAGLAKLKVKYDDLEIAIDIAP